MVDDFGGVPYPVFDYCKQVHIDTEDTNVVIHAGPDGTIAAFHSPLTGNAIKCSICESGVKVWIL